MPTKNGRLTELTQTHIAEIVELLDEGLGIADVCRHVGVRVETFKRWMRIGKSRLYGDKTHDGFDPHIDLFQKANRARVTGRRRLIDLIRIHAHKDWKAAAYLLERAERRDDKSSAAEGSIPSCVFTRAAAEARKLVNSLKA